MWVPFLPGRRLSLLPLLSCPRVLRMRGGGSPWLPLLLVVLAGLPWLVAPGRTHAQQVSEPQIKVEPRIVVRGRSRVALPIEIGPVDALPKKGFVNLRGFPPGVTLTAGHPIAAGSWAVSVPDLATLKADIPAGLSGQADVTISLIALDGRMLAQARTTLVVDQLAATPPAAPGGARADGNRPERAAPRVASRPPAISQPEEETKASGLARQPPRESTKAPAPTSRPIGLSGPEKARAQRALVQGEQYLSRGSILVARQYFELAADAGLATAALRLAATYDPAELQRLQVPGVVPDRDLARKWYERARELGARDADSALARLGGK
jgi:hypothetical protein